MKTRLITKMRDRRNARQFRSAVANASPAMRQELMAASAKHNFIA